MMKRIAQNYLAAHKNKLFTAIALMGVAAAMTATIAKLLKPIMDVVLGDGDERMIVPFALWSCASLLCAASAPMRTPF